MDFLKIFGFQYNTVNIILLDHTPSSTLIGGRGLGDFELEHSYLALSIYGGITINFSILRAGRWSLFRFKFHPCNNKARPN